MYTMVCVCTWTDIFVVRVVSRFPACSCEDHWEAIKWIMRYLPGLSKMCLCYGGNKSVLLSLQIQV